MPTKTAIRVPGPGLGTKDWRAGARALWWHGYSFVKTKDLPMRRIPPREFSFAPLFAMVPGFTVLAAFATDQRVSVNEALLSALVIGAGAVWAGFRQSRVFPETVIKVDTTLASVVLDALPDPVLLLNDRRHVVAANRAAEALLGAGLHGRDIALLLRQPDAHDALKKAYCGDQVCARRDVVFETPVRRSYELQVMGVPCREALSVRAVVALHEVTALKNADTMRADFVANVSHELRSPLSALSGFIETLQTSAQDDAQARTRFLAIMDDEAARMARLIDDLLSLSRIEVNEHIRPTARASIVKIVSGVADLVQLKAQEKNVQIKINVAQNLPDVCGDEDELREVFQNLVDNAVKYGKSDAIVTLDATVIEVCGETGGPGVEVVVSDQGDGIAAEHLPRLTERFYRIDKGRSHRVGGTGLGLAIVKHIVNRHRGRLSVTSEPGKGSMFRVHLPVASP